MKEKIKHIIFGYLPGFITGILLVGTISVIAATYFPSNQTTYDNSTSGMKSTNVQDALDELYNVCKVPASEQIIKDNNLEKDPYECRYFFTGKDPNNYVTFNNEKAGWRILSVECDGTIKIIKNESIGNIAWDSTNSSNWTRPATLNTYLNSTYLNGLSSAAQSQITSHKWSIGAVEEGSEVLQTTVNNENSATWNGKIALPTVSEYLRTNSNKSACGTMYLNTINYKHMNYTCKNTTWMYNLDYNNDVWWTLSELYYGDGHYVFFMLNGDLVAYSGSTYRVDDERSTRPAVYLSSDITLSGTGTKSDPYVIN